MIDFFRGLQTFKLIDVLDTTNFWTEACIIGQQVYQQGINIKVKYLGFSDRWNEWIAADSNRIAPYGTKCYNGTNDPHPNNRILYYSTVTHRWKQYIFLGFENATNLSRIELMFNHNNRDRFVTYEYNKVHIAPISKRNVILSIP